MSDDPDWLYRFWESIGMMCPDGEEPMPWQVDQAKQNADEYLKQILQ